MNWRAVGTISTIIAFALLLIQRTVVSSFFRIALAMKTDKAFNPFHVGMLRELAIAEK
jgi:hypothetical protein